MEMKRRGEIKRRSKVPKIFFFCLTQKKRKKIEPVQNILYWFKTFCTGSKHFVPVQNKIVPKVQIELQHICAHAHVCAYDAKMVSTRDLQCNSEESPKSKDSYHGFMATKFLHHLSGLKITTHKLAKCE